MNRKQKGLTLSGVVIGMLGVSILGIAAFKVGMPYANAKVVEQITIKVLKEVRDDPVVTAGDVAKKIFDRSNIQSAPVDFDAIEIKSKEPGQFKVHIDMTTRIKLWKNAELVMVIPVEKESE